MTFLCLHFAIITTTITMNNHICSESCFKKRTAKNAQVGCFGCTKIFNMNCFSITDNTILKTISSNSNVIFVCGKCSDKIVKSKIDNNRLSSGNRLSADRYVRRSAPSLESTPKAPEAPISTVSNQNLSPQMLNFIETITNKLTQIESKIDLSNEPPIISHSPYPDKTTTITTNDSKLLVDNNTLNNIYSLLLKATDNIEKLHTISNEKESLQKITSMIDKKLNSSAAPKKHANLLDWSLHDSYLNNALDEAAGRPSLMIKQSVDDDILKILKSSDETTWFTLDLIMKKLNEQSSKLDSLMLSSDKSVHNNELNDDNLGLKSPLVDAIRETSINSSVFIPTDSQTENSALKALDSLDSLLNSRHSDANIMNSSLSAAGNPSTMNKLTKEAMSHTNITNVPETLNIEKQKRINPSSSGGWPGNRSDVSSAKEINTHHSAQHDDSQIFESVPRSEIVNLFLNDVCDSDINTLTTGSGMALGSASSSIEDNKETHGPSNNRPNIQHVLINKFHLSNMNPKTSCQNVIDYMLKRGLPESLLDEVNVTRLVAKDRDVSTLTFVSFKLDTSDVVASIISKMHFWPESCILKEFIQKPKPHKPVTDLSIDINASNGNFQMPALHKRSVKRVATTAHLTEDF